MSTTGHDSSGVAGRREARGGRPIRVLVVEDSPTVRLLLTALLEEDPDLTVVGTATNGREAVALTNELRPDVVTMDILMPEMDGYEATRRIMTVSPTPIVVVSGHVDVREVEVSFRALEAGALTLVPKPRGPGSQDFERSSRFLLRTIKSMASVNVVRRLPKPSAQAVAAEPGAVPRRPVSVVAMASSTGGPGALHTILRGLPSSFPAPVLIVQHIAPGFVEGFVKALSAGVALDVRLAERGAPLETGSVYVAPDDRHLVVAPGQVIGLLSTPPVAGFRPSANHLFRSVATIFGPRAVGVMLTGMGRDGVDGLVELGRAGGFVLAQDAATSVVNGMPGAAVRAGVVNRVLPLHEIPAWLREVTLPAAS